jgi:hypothetical protein
VTTHEERFLTGLMGGELAPAPPPPPVEKVAEEPAIRPITAKNLFSNPDTHPVVLDFALLKQFKLDWLTWLPDTLFHEIEQTFKTSIADINRTKIQATQTLHVVDSFWEEWEIFEKTLAALTGVVPLVEVMQPPTLDQLYTGIDIAHSVREETFSEEVARYIAAIFLHEDVHYAAPPLEFCQPFISQPVYACGHCNKKASALPPWDGLCESCGGHYDQEHSLTFKADPEKAAKGWGQDVTVSNTYEFESVKKRFEALNSLPNPSEHLNLDSADDVQAGRLIVAIDHMNHVRRQMKEQLSALKPWLEST